MGLKNVQLRHKFVFTCFVLFLFLLKSSKMSKLNEWINYCPVQRTKRFLFSGGITLKLFNPINFNVKWTEQGIVKSYICIRSFCPECILIIRSFLKRVFGCKYFNVMWQQTEWKWSVQKHEHSHSEENENKTELASGMGKEVDYCITCCPFLVWLANDSRF